MEDWFKALHISSFILGVIFLFLFLAIRKIITKVKSQNSPQELHEWVEKKDLAYWLIIIILFAVSSYTYKYSSNDAVITHWGFAGTIVSIILAIIAIVYTFFDNFTSKSSHQKLEESADRIKDITKKLDSNNLVDSSNKIEEIGLKLEAITSKMDKQLESINNGINDMHNNTSRSFSQFNKKLDDHLGLKAQNINNSGNKKGNIYQDSVDLKHFFYNYGEVTLWNKISLISIGLFDKQNISFNIDDAYKISETISNILTPEDEITRVTYTAMMSVSLVSTIRIFESHGFEVLDNKELEIHPEIKGLLNSFLGDCQTTDKPSGIEKDANKTSYEIAVEAINKFYNID
ncbi:hypothetical protein CN995_10120 [Bacillus cereus]|uniref:hypothetical protein n=1 Tax=Bacillus cereus TaxID=1396 RepID=UPI000BF9C9B7|nr:hypothetical protein [Bacillus cereus]PFD01867.1 hypothetical protein CN289_20780 [Bacillus cereus]PFK65233.1 hypothetical protein COJ25_25985 [Bacillus cereus]PGO13658.1 hypothetical protein CN970_12075 [Bacillus cereus]PGP05888.1 hypothetical protein CN995_10120 [Bacillus cereus]